MNETARETLPDICFTLDYPVLLEVGRWELAGRPDGVLQVEVIAQRLGQPTERVIGALIRLADAQYIQVQTLPGDNRVLDVAVRGMLPAGLREAGPWPKDQDLAAILREALEANVHLLERLDPRADRRHEGCWSCCLVPGPISWPRWPRS